MHAEALTAEATDWHQIAMLYGTLATMTVGGGPCEPRGGGGDGLGCAGGFADAAAPQQSGGRLLPLSRGARRSAASDEPARGCRDVYKQALILCATAPSALTFSGGLTRCSISSCNFSQAF